MVNKNVLSCLLKDGKEVNAVMLVGRLFYARATVTRNDRSPMVLSRVRRTIRRGQEWDRSRCRDSASSVQWSSSARYEGTLWLRQQKASTTAYVSYVCCASTASQNCILSGTRNQCRSRSRWVTWSYLRVRHKTARLVCRIKHGLEAVQQVTIVNRPKQHCHSQVVS